jgi:hypothetical protein
LMPPNPTAAPASRITNQCDVTGDQPLQHPRRLSLL